MRKVAPQDVEKVKEEISKSRSQAEDPSIRNALNILVDKFTRYEPILEELDQVKKVVEQRQTQISQGQGAACEAPAPTGLQA